MHCKSRAHQDQVSKQQLTKQQLEETVSMNAFRVMQDPISALPASVQSYEDQYPDLSTAAEVRDHDYTEARKAVPKGRGVFSNPNIKSFDLEPHLKEMEEALDKFKYVICRTVLDDPKLLMQYSHGV